MQVVEAGLTWTGQGFENQVRVSVKADGRIAAVGRLSEGPTLRLPDEALIPGLVNAHSHSFQIGLRGSAQTFPAGKPSAGAWQGRLHELVDGMGPESFGRLLARAFSEMRRSGITTVGELHYLHHSRDSKDFAFDEQVLSAAETAGIRLALLNTHYRTGSIGGPLSGAQNRFDTGSIESFWRRMASLESLLGARQTLGCAAHSIRAVPMEEIVSLHEEATSRGMVFHMHVEDRLEEIEESIRVFGRRPMELINDQLEVMGNFTAVHCTHTAPVDLERFVAKGGVVCINPLTKANLGDGTQRNLAHAARNLAIGTGSNTRIGMIEEMRWLEYAQRLANETRGVLADGSGRVASILLDAATLGGARSLGINAGRIEQGCPADFATIDLTSPVLEGWTESSLPELVIFGGSEELILRTCVDGVWSQHREAARS